MIIVPGNSADVKASIGALARYLVFLAFLFVCFLGGGGSREDVASLLYLRPIAAVCLIAFVAIPGPIDFRAIRVPFWLTVGLTTLIAIQLIPLPPDLWTALPGRASIAEGADVLGIPQPWRPLSLTPDLTVNSLAAMIVPITALVGFASLSLEQRASLLPILISGAIVSALVAILQISSGAGSIFYTYRVTNEDAAVGLFANRNHQAILLALTVPMLAAWAANVRGDPQARVIKRLSALATAIVLLLMLLVTGSRAGLVLGGVASIWSVFHYLELRRARSGASGRGKTLVVAMAATIAVAAALTYVAYGRAVAIQRLLGQDLAEERRLRYLAQLGDMVRDFFPFGSGFGSFDPMFRMREPFEYLSPTYFNHAHNDLLELLITGGLPAGLLLVIFLAWWGMRGFVSLRMGSRFGVLGAALVLLLLLASLVDYPLRAPIMTTVLAIACGWLGGGRTEEKS